MAPASVFSWTGFYVGAHAGYGFGETDWRWNGALTSTKIKPDGFIGGLQAGFNYQLNSAFLVGLEASASLGDLKKTTTEVFTFGPPPVTFTDAYTTQIRWFGDVSLRAGVTFDRFLVFAKGGFAFGDFKQTNTVSVTGLGSFTASKSFTQGGYLLGAGVEYAFTNNLTAKIEYNYLDFGTKSLGIDPNPLALGAVRFKNSLNVVKAGINYKF